MPAGLGPQGYITASDTALHYTIRFENTGSDTAFMVTILDVLDPDLDLASINMGVSSHNYIWDVINGNTLQIRFHDIFLPDTSSPNNNKGFVCYSIRQKVGLLPGTVINNNAQIYFDFNAPVTTNTTTNTIFNPLSITEYADPRLQLYPNPATDNITIRFNQREIPNLVLYNIYGQSVKILDNIKSDEHSIRTYDISELPSGIYLIRSVGNSNSGIRFVKL